MDSVAKTITAAINTTETTGNRQPSVSVTSRVAKVAAANQANRASPGKSGTTVGPTSSSSVIRKVAANRPDQPTYSLDCASRKPAI